MKTDRELLELAARAAGYELNDFAENGAWAYQKGSEVDFYGELPIFLWSPLTDDGDALRLAVKLSMSVDIDEHEDSTYAYAGDQPRVYAMELWQGNKDAATRRAIVRAAAAIGETL